MKPISLFALSVFVSVYAASAHAAPTTVYANSISAHNIAAMQHTIMNNTIRSFSGTMAAALGSRGELQYERKSPAPQKISIDQYGRMPEYGTMPLYGEYGDDGSVFGRGGGDMVSRPTINGMWLNWQHVGDDAKFDHMDTLDSDYNVIMFGLSGGDAQFGNGITDWGLFGGYAGGTQTNNTLDITENGGYVGFYNGYAWGGLNISLIANAGAMYNSAEFDTGTDEYANMWVGGAINAAYNIALDATFTLQPNVYAGYTWIKSANYTSTDGAHIANQNFNMFEVAPGVRAIKQISRGWFGFIGAKYVFNFAHGGDTVVDNIKLDELEMNDYSEYGLGIETSVDRFNMSINVGRRDGGRTGWTFGTSLKYLF